MESKYSVCNIQRVYLTQHSHGGFVEELMLTSTAGHQLAKQVFINDHSIF